MTWKPILTSQDHQHKASEIIRFVSEKLQNTNNTDSPALLSGSAGVSLFWHYLFKYNASPLYSNLCFNSLSVSLNAIGHANLSHTFCNGLSGILWSLCHLRSVGGINADINEIIDEEIDTLIIQRSLAELEVANYDYLHGGGGLVLYILARPEMPNSQKYLCQIVELLRSSADQFPNGVAWARSFNNDKKYVLGLAHGMPGIIVLLARLLEHGVSPATTSQLLSNSIEWLLNQRRANSDELSLFPNGISMKIPTEGDSQSRVGWCYGDLGVAIALIQASLITHNSTWHQLGVEIGLRTSNRREVRKNGIADAELCHGSAGVALIFNRLYQYTGIDRFRETAIYWYEQTFKLFDSPVGVKSWTMDELRTTDDWIEKYALLDGMSGIGLSLISAMSAEEPKWDRCLLLS